MRPAEGGDEEEEDDDDRHLKLLPVTRNIHQKRTGQTPSRSPSVEEEIVEGSRGAVAVRGGGEAGRMPWLEHRLARSCDTSSLSPMQFVT